jgi:hypothetical protein
VSGEDDGRTNEHAVHRDNEELSETLKSAARLCTFSTLMHTHAIVTKSEASKSVFEDSTSILATHNLRLRVPSVCVA